MRRNVVIAAVVGGVAVIAMAHDVAAQTTRSRTPAVSLAEANTARSVTPSARRGLRFNESGRWGLNFNLNQPVGRDADWGDVEAGAFYRVNPRLRVGAAAGLASPEADPARPPETDSRTAARFRLESIFKF